MPEPLPDELSIRAELIEIGYQFSPATALALHRVFHGDEKELEVRSGDDIIKLHAGYKKMVHIATKKLNAFEKQHNGSFTFMERKYVDHLWEVMGSTEKYEERSQRSFPYVSLVATYLADIALEKMPGLREALDVHGVEVAYKTGYKDGVYAQHVHEIIPREEEDETG